MADRENAGNFLGKSQTINLTNQTLPIELIVMVN